MAHYNNKLFTTMLDANPTKIFTLSDPFFNNSEYDVLRFAFELQRNKDVHNVVISFINTDSIPECFEVDDTYTKVYNDCFPLADFELLKSEWEQAGKPPLQIRLSLTDKPNCNYDVDFTENVVFGVVTESKHRMNYPGYVVTEFFYENEDEMDRKLQKIISKTLVALVYGKKENDNERK